MQNNWLQHISRTHQLTPTLGPSHGLPPVYPGTFRNIPWRAWRVEVCGSKICRFSVCNSPSATSLTRRTAGWVVSCDRKGVERSHVGVEHFQGIFECSHFPPLLNRPESFHCTVHAHSAALMVPWCFSGAAGVAIELLRTSVCRAGAAHCPTQG